jgi:hypothetical protein
VQQESIPFVLNHFQHLSAIPWAERNDSLEVNEVFFEILPFAGALLIDMPRVSDCIWRMDCRERIEDEDRTLELW